MGKTICSKTHLVKISGDLGEKTLDWIAQLSRDYAVTVCVDGGRQMKELAEKMRLPIALLEPFGHHSLTSAEKKYARDALEENRAEVHHTFVSHGVEINVVIPVLPIGTVPCPVNGDQFVLIAYHGFDRISVVATEESFVEKAKFFNHYRRIRVVYPPLFRGRRLSDLESRYI